MFMICFFKFRIRDRVRAVPFIVSVSRGLRWKYSSGNNIGTLEKASTWVITDAQIGAVSAFTTGANEIASEEIE